MVPGATTGIRLTALMVLTLVSRGLGQGEVLVIGSTLPIIAAPGDDVILPCHLEPTFDVQGLTVEWSKPDLKPDPSDRLSRVNYVHLYRDKSEVTDMKIASYLMRTEMFISNMKNGSISLKILNVSEEDNGRYRCFIPKLRSRMNFAIVQLVVDPNYIKTTEIPLYPRKLQTPYPQDTIQGNADHTTVAVITSVFILATAAFTAYFSLRLYQKKISAHRMRHKNYHCKSKTEGTESLKASSVLDLHSPVGDSNQQPQGDAQDQQL